MVEPQRNAYLNFDKFLLPLVVKILHIISIIVILILCMYSLSMTSTGYVILIWLGSIVAYLLIRIVLENIILIYKIYEKLNKR